MIAVSLIIITLVYYILRGNRRAKQIRKDYDSAMMRVVEGDSIVYFVGSQLHKGEVVCVLPDLVQVLTETKVLMYIERSKISAVCLN
jgi:preprotein translocase subunit YajC